MSGARTLFDKLWDAHVVRELGGGWVLLHIDRHLLHDLSGPPALAEVAERGLRLHDADLAFSTPDPGPGVAVDSVSSTLPVSSTTAASTLLPPMSTPIEGFTRPGPRMALGERAAGPRTPPHQARARSSPVHSPASREVGNAHHSARVAQSGLAHL